MPIYAEDLLPNTTGQNLGSSGQTWDAYIRNLTVSGTLTGVGTFSGNATTIQGRAVLSTAPSNNQVLTWSTGSNAWKPLATQQTISLQIAGIETGDQAILNLLAGPHISITDDGVGGISIAKSLEASLDVINTNNANIASAALFTASATNLYRISAYLNSRGDGSGTLASAITWTDLGGAETYNLATTLATNAVGYAQASLVARVAISTNVSYSVTKTGTVGHYDFYIRAESLV